MKITVHQSCPESSSYRAARVRSLFNAPDDAHTFATTADLKIDDGGWKIGVIVGPSGSGKTSIGRNIWGPHLMWEGLPWSDDAPIVDDIAPSAPFDDVTAALASVGLGDVPAWLRPYRVLSNGERFRAELARLIAERPERVVVDEFSSVVDRQIAKVGAGAFAKAWRRGEGQAVLLTCHYDVLDWIEPDWVYDTLDGHFARGSLQHQRPSTQVEIRQGDWSLWPYFEPHHYLKLPRMIAATCYVAYVDGWPVAHLGVSTASRNLSGGRTTVEARACRMVVMPEWQGAGIGMRFLNAVCQLQLEGKGRLPGRRMTTQFHTSHPGLCAALRRDRRWRQMSASVHGAFKGKRKAAGKGTSLAGYGGHTRAVQGFRYLGERKETQ